MARLDDPMRVEVAPKALPWKKTAIGLLALAIALGLCFGGIAWLWIRASSALTSAAGKVEALQGELAKAPKQADLDAATKQVDALQAELAKAPKQADLAAATKQVGALQAALAKAPKQSDLDAATKQAGAL